MMKKHDSIFKSKIIKSILLSTMIIGIIFTLIYIFYTSTALLTSDSVITDVLVHQQIINKEFLLTHWYYGNEFWILSLSIPTLLLSPIIKNVLLLRQVSVLVTAIMFFYLLYKYGKKFLNKKETIILITIFLTGISYSVLDYFYAFNAYLTVVINSLITIYLCFKGVEEKKNKKIYYISALIMTFLINLGSLRYFPSVTLPFILTELFLLIRANKNSNVRKIAKENKIEICKTLGILIISLVGICTFKILTTVYHYEQRAGSSDVGEISSDVLIRDLGATVDCVNNFFGYDNENHPLIFLTGEQYFADNHKKAPLVSFFTFTNVIKIIMCIIVMIITPIILYKNYKKNDKKINFLLVYNSFSWLIMIFLYVFTFRFFYNCSELKYFLLNIIINFVLTLYCLYNYIAKSKKKEIIIDIIIILYIISNLYSTYLVIKTNDKKVMSEKYELVELLKKNNLTYGYGGFWNGLLTNFLSDYDITVIGVQFPLGIKKYKWYSDERWYKNPQKGKTFLILDEKSKMYFKNYKKELMKPRKILKCKGYEVYVYNENPFTNIP